MTLIGSRIIEVCEIVDEIGPSNYWQVFEQMDECQATNAGKYCRRAVEYGFMTVDRDVWPAIFQIVEGWEDLLEKKQRQLRRGKSASEPIQPHALQTVWANFSQRV